MKEQPKRQVFNPYLPQWEYIPDGEPHVFKDRVYLYGSHDRFDGEMFCLNDYVCYSADIHDLTDWKYEGVIFKKDQDPRNEPKDIPDEIPPCYPVKSRFPGTANPPGVHALWAPDVVQGKDGRFYLYYCLDYLPEIGVAVCDSPAGKYEFLGFVKYGDGTILGTKADDRIQFDPGIFIDDDGEIYLYSGNAPMYPEHIGVNKDSQVMTLQDDMLTLKTSPRPLLPTLANSKGTGFEGHEFFEASSIRKIGDTYYFVYSSVKSSELCYAVSKYPDRDYAFGGTIIDIGNIGIDGRTRENSANCLGNTHGGMECIDGQWYIFYHRQTNRTNFSRQGCAEKIQIDKDGKIKQVEVTSCGLNPTPLMGTGTYPAYICCHLTGKDGIPMSGQKEMQWEYPFLTQSEKDYDPDHPQENQPLQYIANIQDKTVIGYKYFDITNVDGIRLRIRGRATGSLEIGTRENLFDQGQIPIDVFSFDWTDTEVAKEISIPPGVQALYFRFTGSGWLDLAEFTLQSTCH